MLRFVFLAIGVAVFVLLLVHFGVEDILSSVQKLGWNVVGLLFLYAAMQLVRAAALATCVVSSGPVRFRDVLWVRLSGEAVQFLTFTGPLLSEPTKAYLLRDRGLTTQEAFATVVTEWLGYTFSSTALSMVGLWYFTRAWDVGGNLALGARIVAYGSAGFLLISALAIVKRVYLIGAVIQGLSRLPLVRRSLRPDMAWVNRLEDRVLIVLRDRPTRLGALLALETLAQLLLICELAWILRALGSGEPMRIAFVSEAAVKFPNLVFFFIPTQVGAAEGVYAMVFGAVGLPAAAGFAVAFIRRLRSLLVAGVGLLCLSLLTRRRRTPPPAAAGVQRAVSDD